MTRGRSLVLDRQFRGVGRIKRATGTDDPKLFNLLNAMLTTLYRAGRIDVLQAIKTGGLTPLEVWSRYRTSELDRLPTVETMKLLHDELETWVEHADTGLWNRAARRYGVRAILRLANKDSTVQDLPRLLREYATSANGATMFNRARSAIQAYLRDTVGKSHPIYLRVTDVRAKRVVTREGNPQSPDQMRALTAKLHPAHANIAWAMALTGMGPGELWGSWKIEADHIHVRGTKRDARVRRIPLIWPIERPTRKYRRFLIALDNASEKTVKPYDLRRTFAHWMEMAGIPRTRRRMYMGHRVADITELYERHDVTTFLQKDGERLREYLGPTSRPLRLYSKEVVSG